MDEDEDMISLGIICHRCFDLNTQAVISEEPGVPWLCSECEKEEKSC